MLFLFWFMLLKCYVFLTEWVLETRSCGTHFSPFSPPDVLWHVSCRPQTTIGTAMVLCHRFFVRQSHASHDRFVSFCIVMSKICRILYNFHRLDFWELNKMFVFFGKVVLLLWFVFNCACTVRKWSFLRPYYWFLLFNVYYLEHSSQGRLG